MLIQVLLVQGEDESVCEGIQLARPVRLNIYQLDPHFSSNRSLHIIVSYTSLVTERCDFASMFWGLGDCKRVESLKCPN